MRLDAKRGTISVVNAKSCDRWTSGGVARGADPRTQNERKTRDKLTQRLRYSG